MLISYHTDRIYEGNSHDHLPMLQASEIVVKVFQIYDQMLKICPF